MARKAIVWSERAQQDRIQILDYWIKRNKSKAYSEKLLQLFIQAAEVIAAHPSIGRAVNQGHIRFKVVRDYLMFYEELEDHIEILLIWDNRRNPDNLKELLNQ